MKCPCVGASIPSLIAMAREAMRAAVKKVIRQHARSGDPLVIWRGGRVVKLPPSCLTRPKA